MNNDNMKLLRRYNMICRNKGLTQESIKAICGNDIPLFLRYIDPKPLKEISHIDVEDFFQYCMDTRGNSATTMSRKFASLNMFFKTLIKKDYLDMKNPLDKLDKIKTRKKIRGHLEKEEVDRILSYLDSQQDLRGAAIVSLFYSSGCRLSEIHQLNRNSLNFNKRQFIVTGKGQKQRVCVFSVDTKNRILKYLQSRKDNNEALFISRSCNRWCKKSIQDFVKATGKRAGITKNVHPHIFRHSRAMYLLKQGVPLETIQRLLGHENISTTQIYAHNTILDVQDEIDAIDEAG